LLLLALFGVAVLASEGRRRNIPLFAATFLAIFAVLWFATGQGLGNAGDYLANSVEIISGYSSAMVIESPSVSWDRWAAALIVAAARRLAAPGLRADMAGSIYAGEPLALCTPEPAQSAHPTTERTTP
jgi:hypothetical protein